MQIQLNGNIKTKPQVIPDACNSYRTSLNLSDISDKFTAKQRKAPCIVCNTVLYHYKYY